MCHRNMRILVGTDCNRSVQNFSVDLKFLSSSMNFFNFHSSVKINKSKSVILLLFRATNCMTRVPES